MAKEKYIVKTEDLVSNLIIESKLRYKKNYITYEELDKYINNLKKQTINKNIDLIFDVNRDKTYLFLQLYSNFFVESDNRSKIILKNDVSEIDLINKFRGYLPFNLLLVMINDDIIKNSIIYEETIEKNKIK